MPRFVKKLKEKLSSADSNKGKQAHVSLQPDPPPVPNGPLPSPKPRSTTEPVSGPEPLQGRLWNEAYELLRLSNTELVQSYEKILSWELLRGQYDASEPASLENRIDPAYGERWKQMHLIVDAALKRQEEGVARKQKIGGGLAAINLAMRQAVRTVPEAAVAWTGVCLAFEVASNSLQEAKANHDGMAYVVSRMEWYWHLAELLLDANKRESAPSALQGEMEKHIIDLYGKLLLYQMKSICRFHGRYGSALWRAAIKADDWVGQLDEIRSVEATIREDSRVFNALEMQRRLDEIERGRQMLQNEIQGIWPRIQEHILSKEAEQCLQDLRVTDPRDDKSRIEDTNGGLLQGAYDWAINHNDFITWRDEEENRLLWIKGDPGKGKTMLVCGIIEELQSRGVQPCYFFCQATDPRLNNATAVLRGLIYLLMDTNRQLLSHIQEKYDQAGTALFQDVNSWIVLSQIFTELLENPSLDGQVFMIDAVDECTDLERLLNLVSGNSATHHARWIVSSRNWTTIEAKLGAVSQKIRFSLELNEQSVSEAVSLYVSHKATQLRIAKGLDVVMEQKVRKYLTDNARGTFLWVALVCKELLKLRVRKRHLLKKMAEFPPDLEPLYERMMQQIHESEDSDLCERILKAVAIVCRPVTLAELASLLDLQDDLYGEDLEEIVASCGSFLVVRDDMVRFVHQSAKDFLLGNKGFATGLASQHYSLFSRSLEILTVTLRRDMYNLRHPGALIQEHTPSQHQDVLRHAKYSCIYWVDHLRAVDDLDREKCILSLQDGGILHHFLRKKLLNWLEACSLMNQMSDATRTIRSLRTLAPVENCTMRNIIEDTYRFVLYHKVGVELAPLQVYVSAIIFSPKSSLIRQLYEGTDVPDWITTKPDMPSGWTARLQYLEGHPSASTLAFSPDGTKLASGCFRRIATVWDTETGAPLHTFGCPAPVLDMAFSPDGRYLATGSEAGVEIRDAMTLTSNLYTFLHDCSYTRITFSPDSARLAATFKSAKTGSCIRTWDIGTGKEANTRNFGKQLCLVTAFAPDGTHLALVADREYTPHIWNLTANKHQLVLDIGDIGWAHRIRLARFSLDASRLAIATRYCLCVFEVLTGECLLKLGGPTVPRWFRFLHDPKRLMSSENTSFTIRDISTGTCMRQVRRDSRHRDDRDTRGPGVAIPSPDGMLVAESNQLPICQGIGLWDMTTALSNGSLGDIIEEVTAIALSPDGTQLATASESEKHGKMIKIRDLLTGACLTGFTCSKESIASLAFSLNNKWLASGAKDGVQVWDIAMGLNVQNIQCEILGAKFGIRPSTSAIAISSNGDLVAATFIRTVKAAMWDLTSTEILQHFDLLMDMPYDGLVAAAFSPDDARLVFASQLGNFYICNVKTGRVQLLKDFCEPLDIYRPSPLQLLNGLQLFDGECEVSQSTNQFIWRRKLDKSRFKASDNGRWLLKGQHRVLWLPPDYRPWEMMSQEGCVVLRVGAGRILLVRFAVDELDALLA